MRRLLDALLALLPPQIPAAAGPFTGGAAAGSFPGAHVQPLQEEAAVDAPEQLPTPPAQQAAEGGRRLFRVFSEKQCEMIRGWSTEYERSFRPDSEGGGGAGPGHRLGGDELRVSGAVDVHVGDAAAPPSEGPGEMSEKGGLRRWLGVASEG